jgi:CYTH domain-containing protein
VVRRRFYGSILQGVIIAEIELKQEDQELTLPTWIGNEVTGDSPRRDALGCAVVGDSA